MSPTATKSRPRTDVLAQLERHETEVKQLADEKDALSAEAWGRTQRLAGRPGNPFGLVDDLRKLQTRDPHLFNDDGTARDPKSEAGKLVAEVDKLLSGLDELRRKADHAKRVWQRRLQGYEEFVRENYEAIEAAMTPAGEQVRDALGPARAEFLPHLDAYINHYDRLVTLAGIASKQPGALPIARDIKGGIAAKQFRRALADLDLPVPTR